MKSISLDDLAPDRFFSPPSGIGGKAVFDASGLVRYVDAIVQGWLAGKIALAEGDLLPGAFGGDIAWISFAARQPIGTLLTDVEETFLSSVKGKVLALVTRYPEIQQVVEDAVQKLDDRANLARAARNRFTTEEVMSPLRLSLNDYTPAYTALNIAKARVPLDTKTVEVARQQVALLFDQVTRAHTALKRGLDAIINSANRFWASLANLPMHKFTPAQWRSAQEYHAIITALKGAWAFPALVPVPPASLPTARGKNLFHRVFTALRKRQK